MLIETFKKIKTILALKKKDVLVFGVAVAVVVLVFYALFMAAGAWRANKNAEHVTRVNTALQEEADTLLEHARAMDEARIFDDYIRERDIVNLIALATSERRERDIGGILITDEDGVVLTRTKAVSQRGDFLFHTRAYGRQLAAGHEVAAVVEGGAWPLIVTGAVPLVRGDIMTGSIVAAHIVDNAYARRFARRHLSDGAKLAFYSREEGIVGSTMDDPEARRILSSYFTVGSDWVQNGRTDEMVRIADKDYSVNNLVFEGVGSSPGGVLVFVPHNTAWQSALLALVVMVAALGAALLVLFVFGRDAEEAHHIHLVLGAMVIFATVFVLSSHVLEQDTTVLSEPQFTIYNSTMHLDPSSGIVDRAFEHRVAIEIITGGEPINASQVTLLYDPTTIRVADIVTTRSFCDEQFFLEQSIDNDSGRVQIACILPGSGFSGEKAVVAELIVQPLTEGRFDLRFGDETAVLAHDGLGTNVLRRTTGGEYQAVSRLQSDQGPPALLVFSPTHPNPARWYNTGDILLTWQAREGYRYRYAFKKIDGTVIERGTVSDADSLRLTANEDGIYETTITPVHETDRAVLGPTSYRFKIDATPPSSPIIETSATRIQAGEVVRMTFEGSDAGSGLERTFYVRQDEGLFLPVGREFYTAFQKSGTYEITVRTFDNAGNLRDSTQTITVTP